MWLLELNWIKILTKGIVQTLRNAGFGKNLDLPPPLEMVRNISNMPTPSVV